jgi:hypothetical protein
VAGRVHNINLVALIVERRVLGENGDAALALLGRATGGEAGRERGEREGSPAGLEPPVIW